MKKRATRDFKYNTNQPRKYQKMDVEFIPRPVPVPKSFLRFNNQQQIVQYQQTRPGGEIKSIDITNSTTPTTNTEVIWPMNTTPKINCLNLITIGSSQWNRIGRKISMKSLRLRGNISVTGFAATSPQPMYCRLTVLYDKQSNGALPTAPDIFLDQASVAADSSLTTYTSGINLNNRERFEVIWDKQWVIPPSNTSTGAAGNSGLTATADCLQFDWFVKLRNREVHYKADSSPAVIGDIATGSLVMVTQSNIAAASEPYGLSTSIRLRYSDL